jgi:dynein heavy chain
MALTDRHRWCITKILEAFKDDLQSDIVQAFMRQEAVATTFATFFKGESSGRLFVFYQPDLNEDEISYTDSNSEKQLSVSDGNNGLMTNKCCYFVRNVAQGVPLDTGATGGADLLFGEVGDSPLSTIEALLSQTYAPVITTYDSWGKVDEEQRADFMNEIDSFTKNINEAITSFASGLELTPPDPKILKNVEVKPNRTAISTEAVNHFESLLNDWCNSIDRYESSSSNINNFTDEVGPRSELEYWRSRMQKLTSITEQLKRPDIKQVISVLSQITKNTADSSKQNIVTLLRRWKQIDVSITESANEAKDNVKYLFTLERFIDPLYNGTAEVITDTLPALMNSIKMIHTIARYFNSNECMERLFCKITDQMIANCKKQIMRDDSLDELWESDPQELGRKLEACLKLNEAYQEQYRLTKLKLEQTPKGKQFSFNEIAIFGKFDLFCRRVIKLVDLFSTIDQFNSLADNQKELDDMDHIINQFKKIVDDFRRNRHQLLDFNNNKFDRDYVEFNVKITDLEANLQAFINQSFDSISNIEHSLQLLKKFQNILQRESLKSDLDSKLNNIFQRYGQELELVQQLYEKEKHDPPIPRNLPPVAGNITWSRHLLKRIEEPMKQFESNQNVLAEPGSKRIIKMYNKVAKTLVAFEYLWYQAWVQSIEQAKAGLQATLIIRHPDDGKLYVNFDQEILQLIREAKCLDRMGVDVPDAARIVLFQEDKFKSYHNELHWALSEHDKIVHKVIPVTAMVLRPHFRDMEYKLRPGMITLTWTSMNIDTYKAHVQSGLRKLEELVTNINDIIENRIEKNLKLVSRTLLVDLPDAESFTVEEFVRMQEKHISQQSTFLQGKNLEIEFAVSDLIKTISSYKLDGHVEEVSEEEIMKLKKHYNHFMYTALLHCAKNSMNALKKRIGSKPVISDGSTPAEVLPFFEVDIRLEAPEVVLHPSLDEIQECINKSAQAILRCFKDVKDWTADIDGPRNRTFFDRITKDIEIVRVALLLTGCIQGIRNTVQEYLNSFTMYNWLWYDDKEKAYKVFMELEPNLDDFDKKLKSFGDIDDQVGAVNDIQNIGALSLRTVSIKAQLKSECDRWKVKFSDNLHVQAKEKLELLTEFIRMTNGKVSREVTDLDSLCQLMDLLVEVRGRESSMDFEIRPIMDMYRMLESYLPDGFMEKEETDKKTVLVSNWKKLLKLSETRTEELSRTQTGYKRTLLKDIKEFKSDVASFREDFLQNGPLKDTMEPSDAVDCLNRFNEELKIRTRKQKSYKQGEELFALPVTDYPELEETTKQLKLADGLFGLYQDVLETENNWKTVLWTDVSENITDMTDRIEAYFNRVKKLPGKLREYKAYKDLKEKVENFQLVLPLIAEFTKESIKDRHWAELIELTETDPEALVYDDPEFKLVSLLEIDLVTKAEEIEEITDGADKQMKIEKGLDEIETIWESAAFVFKDQPGRNGVQILAATGAVVEELEETQMNLQAFLTMRHVTPFRERAQEKLNELTETGETLENWVKLQTMWASLESVFTGGDIAKQMPVEAKKFGKVDKEFVKIMANAANTSLVVEACKNEVLRTSLKPFMEQLEACQRSLDFYLEQKRNKFPRFYFVSDSGLLIILSQGSDPLSMKEHYEKVFDAISYVEHNKKDKTIIEKMHGDGDIGHEIIPFSTPVKAQGNIEEWLLDLLKKMQFTMKDLTRSAAGDLNTVASDINNQLRPFVNNNNAQFALLGIQILWTTDMQISLEAIRGNKKAMPACYARQADILAEMSRWCLETGFTAVERRKIETLVTIHVHARDVTMQLTSLAKSKRINDPNDFEWLKQARFYWKNNAGDGISNEGACVISITDVDFNYEYEYLGAKERLVVTPLTDRCYITLAQALGMFFGGAPAGPAGTGKTETVKDLGRTLGIFVVVTNCTDQQSYKDCAKIFKGLCIGGLWGCFDEFNRIRLPVLSVVAQQVLSVLSAKKAGALTFQFPGDPQNVGLIPCCAFFITMNPGYAGRQELPENLKALFRGVAMMVPDFQIIIKVKLCSVGYENFDMLSQKFFVLYNTSKEQLSAQKHYDWGLRNILSVLRTAGATKRTNLTASESFLLYRTLRDMNLSKMVAQDVPLFLSLLADLFPNLSPPAIAEYPELEAALKVSVENNKLVYHTSWVRKVLQLYDTTLVRHGIMLVGPTGGGKSEIFRNLRTALEATTGTQHREQRLNPKAIRAQEMYGEMDNASGEWTTGVFAAIWKKFNNRANAFNTWIVNDGPVDAIWIEDLNTVLDDNRILTLANGDRTPMTDNVKIMFEVETLVNASPATVSRAGIIYVSETDLDWTPTLEAWVRKQDAKYQTLLRACIAKYLGESSPVYPGHLIDFLNRNCTQVIKLSRVGTTTALSDLFKGLVEGKDNIDISQNTDVRIERIFLYCLVWSVGGVLDVTGRHKIDEYIRNIDATFMPELKGEEDTIYEYFVTHDGEWSFWKPPAWHYPEGQEKLDFSNLLVPTMDSTRANYNCFHLHKQKKSICLVGGEGTAKTSTALMFFNTLDPTKMLVKRVNFSSATTPFMAQQSVEVELEKRGGKNFGPPGGRAMTIFMDDVSMPEINTWGDQPTLEMVRLIVEQKGFYFLDKDKRGDFKQCEDLQFMAAMQNPGGGKNEIPNRLKRNFFVFNMVLPSIVSINDMYGQMLAGRFPKGEVPAETLEVVNKLTEGTIALWKTMQNKMLPTPAKFHYIFNLRELSRVFQGILMTPTDTVKTGGFRCEQKLTPFTGGGPTLLRIWKHECFRVFSDKLTNLKDKATFAGFMEAQLHETFGPEMAELTSHPFYMVNFLRPDVLDEDGGVEEEAPKVYEPGGTLEDIRPICMDFLDRYNLEYPSKKMDLVLFNDALEHLLRINRLTEMPRGSGLLVGVGGSGKQSLVRMSSFMSRAINFQITLTKTYGKTQFLENIKELYMSAGVKFKPTTFLFTESEIKDEIFLEYINSVLLTGEIPNLIAKDEMMSITSDVRNQFVKERPGIEDTQDNLKQFFIDKVRDNLHMMICMSPMNVKFPIRARKFPGLVSCPTIDWFLPWPSDALVALSQAIIQEFPMECEDDTKQGLMTHMGMVHTMVTQVCDEYFTSMRRKVFQTPKSYLSFIKNFTTLYSTKLTALKDQEERVNLGLEKLMKGAEDVEKMKIVLAEQQVQLEIATVETNTMLASLEVSSAEAQKESAKVGEIKSKCEADATRIGKDKEECMAQLAQAQPFVDDAETAIKSIKPGDISEMKQNKNPIAILQLVFDGILVLFKLPMNPIKFITHTIAKQPVDFFESSFKPHGSGLLVQSDFLQQIMKFGDEGKDKITEETIELLSAYTNLESFSAANAKSASAAAEGLCKWVRAMKDYHGASKIVKPRLEALQIAEGNLAEANRALASAEVRLKACNDRLGELQAMFDAQMSEKRRIEDGAMALQRTMTMASQLINGLAGERIRWTEDSNNFASQKMRLVGDSAAACAFVSYCGPFNQEFRSKLVDKFIQDCMMRNVPITQGIDVITFLVDIGTVGDWNIQGLPNDPLSTQNGILVTQSSRFPLMVDPQGQALNWIRNKEATNVAAWSPCAINDNKLKDKLEQCMGDGMAMIVIGVEEDIDPMLDPILEKQIITKGRRKLINVADKPMDYVDSFMMYFITRLPNPNFSPELQAKTNVVDFTVTQKGLEEQLLGKVIGKEQKALEDQLNGVLEEVNMNTKSLLALDASLLQRLTSNTGNLLQDEELIGVLANTKAKAAEVKNKLVAAAETKASIAEKREQFRPVATRGSVLYFAIVEMSGVNVMYQTSLVQFLILFNDSMDQADKAALASKRVANIIDTMTYIVYRYVNRGLYEKDKLCFILLVTLKILITAQELKSMDLTLFLRGGAALDIDSVRRKPFNWMSNEAWLNVIELSQSQKFFQNLPNDMISNEAMWRRWYEDNEPENLNIPEYETKIAEVPVIGPFYKLLLVRSLRMDRCMLVSKWFVRNIELMGPRYVEPVTDTIESIYDSMDNQTPVIFLLSTGADPTEPIEGLARKKKIPSPAVISMGEGQKEYALKAMDEGAKNGTWVLLQNCELGLDLMVEMEDRLATLYEEVDPQFRLFITALPEKTFPLGLLQMSTKVTNEPPAGLKAGVLKSYTVLVDQDRLERVDTVQWRQLLFALCFMHSTVQERRKFGPLGWGIPYEYNNGDLTACILFLEKHLYNGNISWPTFQYMVSEAQYGGKITDTLDRRLFITYTNLWLNNTTCGEGFSFNPKQPIYKIPDNFVYKVEQSAEIQTYHNYLKSFPEIDSPEIFGLHPNADLTFRVKEVNALFATLGDTQPKGGGGGGEGMSREDVVAAKALELLERLPEHYNEDDYKAKINKLGGLSVPLNIFLYQEIQRFQAVLLLVTNMLKQLRLAINGEVVMTEQLQNCLDDMFDAKPPGSWLRTVAGDEFSWLLPTLGLWFSSLLLRDDQYRTWLNGSRPNSYWLTGFFNPQGMLTAMKQEVCRKHQKDANKWALDDIVYKTEVQHTMNADNIKSGPSEGVYVHGLFLEGGAWARDETMLKESEPKVLYVPLPVLMVSAQLKSEDLRTRKEIYGSWGPYECPCYKYRNRTDRYYIFMVNLKCTAEKNPGFWTLRAVALLCNTD